MVPVLSKPDLCHSYVFVALDRGFWDLYDSWKLNIINVGKAYVPTIPSKLTQNFLPDQSRATPEISHGAPPDGALNKIYDNCRSPTAFHTGNCIVRGGRGVDPLETSLALRGPFSIVALCNTPALIGRVLAFASTVPLFAYSTAL
jgi:hypothetical protein